MMRIDKFFSMTKLLSRRDAAAAAAKGRITVDGMPVLRCDVHIDPDRQSVCLDGVPVVFRTFFYFMMNKPAGVVSSNEEPGETTVFDLLSPSDRRLSLFPCGRLDKNTTGLVLLTNDGALSHKLLAPKSHVEKEYAFCLKYPLNEQDRLLLEHGVDIGEDHITKPCRIAMETDKSGSIVLTEGKYHQIKRMAQTVHNQITSLHRVRFGSLLLGNTLPQGQYRPLTDTEITELGGTLPGRL